jgi:membrane-associated phospholipid phosphatase
MGRRPILRGRVLRSLAWGAVCAGIALPLARRRLRVPPPLTVAAVAAAPFGLAVARPRSRARDVAIYGLQMWAFIVVHELPYDRREALERRVRVRYPIACDTALGLGVAPTVRLQRLLHRPDRNTALDRVLVWVHWLWFLEPHAAAAWILWRRPERFARSAMLICAPFDLGAVLYFLVPTAPPWWAGEQGLLPVRRVMEEVGRRFWGRFWEPLYDFLGGNPLAAMPSLHFATSLMTAEVLSEIGPVEGLVGWSYAGALGFALVYLGEHYVVDLLVGATLAEGTRALAPRVAPALARLSGGVQALEARARS